MQTKPKNLYTQEQINQFEALQRLQLKDFPFDIKSHYKNDVKEMRAGLTILIDNMKRTVGMDDKMEHQGLKENELSGLKQNIYLINNTKLLVSNIPDNKIEATFLNVYKSFFDGEKANVFNAFREMLSMEKHNIQAIHKKPLNVNDALDTRLANLSDTKYTSELNILHIITFEGDKSFLTVDRKEREELKEKPLIPNTNTNTNSNHNNFL